MSEYEVGTKIKKRENYYGATFLEGEIVAKHQDGRWIVEVTKALPDRTLRVDDLIARYDHILDEYYEVIAPETFFVVDGTYRFKTYRDVAYTIFDVYSLPDILGRLVDYAVAKVTNKNGAEHIEVLGKYEFKRMVRV